MSNGSHLYSIPGVDGFGFFAQDGGAIGPCAAIWDTETPTDLAGTVSATASSTLTGVGTAFQTDFAVGDYMIINTSPTPTIVKIRAIASATSLTMADPETGLEATYTIAALSTYAKWTTLYLGKSMEAGISFDMEEKIAGTKTSDDGEVETNHFSTGSELIVKVPLAEASLERLVATMTKSINVTRDANGMIVAASFGNRVGRNFKANAKRLTLISYKDGTVSTTALDRLDVFKAYPMGNLKIERNATAQYQVELTFRCYADPRYKKNGVPQFGAIANSSMTFDT